MLSLLFGLAADIGLFLAAHALVARALGLRGLYPLVRRDRGVNVRPGPRLAVRLSGVLGVLLVPMLLMLAATRAVDAFATKVVVEPGLPAAAAGLRDGDVVRAVDGEPVETFEALGARVRGAAAQGGPLVLSIERDGRAREVPVTPSAAGRIGIRAAGERVRVSWGEALSRSTRGVLLMPATALVTFGRLARVVVTGKVPTENLGGPIAIVAGAPAEQRVAWLLYVLAMPLAMFWPAFLTVAVVLCVLDARRERQADVALAG